MNIDQEAHVKKVAAPWNPFGQNLSLERVMPGGVVEQLITLGSTRLSEYTKISVLGKGTYGEVYKCVHNPTA